MITATFAMIYTCVPFYVEYLIPLAAIMLALLAVNIVRYLINA